MTGSWEQLDGALETLAITIGRAGLADWATQVARSATDLVDSLATLNPEMLRLGTIAGVAATATGPIIIGLGAVTAAVAAIGAPVALAVAAVAALGAALFAFRNSLGPLVNAAKPVFDVIANTWRVAIAKIQSLFDNVVAGFREGFVGGIGRVMAIVPGLIAGHITNIIRTIVSFSPQVSTSVLGWFQNIRWSDVGRALLSGAQIIGQTILSYFKGFAQGFASARGADLQRIGKVAVEAIASAIQRPRALVERALQSLFDIGNQLAAYVQDRFAALAPGVVDGVKLTARRALAGVTEAMKSLFDIAEPLKTYIRDKLGSLSDAIVRWLSSAIDRAKAMLGSAWQTLFGSAGAAAETMGQSVDRAAESVGNLGKLTGDSLQDIENLKNELSGAAGQAEILGGANDDLLGGVRQLGDAMSGAAGSTSLMGSAGNDLLTTSRNLTPALTANAEALRLVGGSGTDTLQSLDAGWSLHTTNVQSWTEQISSAFSGTFMSMKSTLGDFVRTGQLDFDNLASAVIGDFISMGVDGVFAFAQKGLGDLLGFSEGGTATTRP
ncbi:phage tail tape measure C-terminal domain-containing protein [Geminicoccus flavidas]|uniref:phage tail tape measure C-terminal domain-containing protein n=1 Tax=Geminicoccus flavidas TaxID=2506407 RepID=UPI00135858E5|nr:phage tail tape measure C-terminal domain-containing protein [Geminicoccus flavidas]